MVSIIFIPNTISDNLWWCNTSPGFVMCSCHAVGLYKQTSLRHLKVFALLLFPTLDVFMASRVFALGHSCVFVPSHADARLGSHEYEI